MHMKFLSYMHVKAKEYYSSGSHEQGRQAVHKARIIIIIAIVIGILIGLASIAIGVVQVVLGPNTTRTRTFTVNRFG